MPTGLFNLKQVNQAIGQGAWSGYIAPKWVEYLVVAGGGGAGRTANGAGGGGGGGVLSGIVSVAAGTSYTVTVGSGGAGSTSTGAAGSSGVASVLGSLSAVGGGGGASGSLINTYTNATSGGSGGGGTGGSSGTGTTGAQGTANQGNAGGNGSGNFGGGGGGAGTVGLNSPNTVAGNGGAGIASAISGSVVAYGGGGAGGINNAGAGTGGVGGGGSTGPSSDSTGGSGGGNTGGGGGGGWAAGANQNGGAGGSGIVVVRYPGNVQFYTGGTVTYSNGYIVHNFTASGTLAPTTPTVVSEYQITRSLRFNQPDSAYLNRTPASATNQKTWTWSAWVKRGTISSLQTLFGTWSANTDAAAFGIYFGSGDTLGVLPWTNAIFTSTAVFRDPSAWYHIVVAFDSTQATASNRVIVYVNGVNQVGTYPLAVTQNANYAINSAQSHRLGDFPASGFNTFGGYMTEVNFIDGQALPPTSFGYVNPTTGIWTPAKYVGAYGTNGFYLNFSDNSNTTAATLGKDYSGNGNNWTPNNFSVTAGAGNDSLVDSPTSYGTDTGVGGTVRGNYATLNPLYIDSGSASTFSNGNLEVNTTGRKIRSTIAIPANSKTYAEFVATSIPNFTFIGATNGSDEPNMASGNYGYSEYAAGDVIGIAVDTTANTINFYKNGVLFSARQTTITAGTTYFYVVYGQAATPFVANFGQRPFAYTAPSGFKALCTQNLPTPTIGATTATQAGKFFNPVIYTGAGGSQTISGVGFQPDWVWMKSRNLINGHILQNAVTGVTKGLQSNTTGAEFTDSSTLTAFNSDGFVVGGNPQTNASGTTFVAWNWKANGSGSSNTSGSITSTVSANTTSGFSVVTYTGATSGTVGHGLGVSPAMIIAKSRSNTTDWTVYHQSLGINAVMVLNGTNPVQTISNYWGSSTPSSTVFGLWSSSGGNNTGTMVAYCFAEVAGYSKFGSFTGNGSADGPFVFTGMRPAFVMFKLSSGVDSWLIYDAKRNTYNVLNNQLYANSSGAESVGGATQYVDFVSNGFKLRGADSIINGSGSTYIYAAFAENPFKYSLAR